MALQYLSVGMMDPMMILWAMEHSRTEESKKFISLVPLLVQGSFEQKEGNFSVCVVLFVWRIFHWLRILLCMYGQGSVTRYCG